MITCSLEAVVGVATSAESSPRAFFSTFRELTETSWLARRSGGDCGTARLAADSDAAMFLRR